MSCTVAPSSGTPSPAAVNLDLYTRLPGLLCPRPGVPRLTGSPSESIGGRSGIKASKLPLRFSPRQFAGRSPLAAAILGDLADVGLLRDWGLPRGGLPRVSGLPRPSMHGSGVFGSGRQLSSAQARSSSAGGRGPSDKVALLPGLGSLAVTSPACEECMPPEIGDAVHGSSRSHISAIGVIQARDQVLWTDSTYVLPEVGGGFMPSLLSAGTVVGRAELAMPGIPTPGPFSSCAAPPDGLACP
mmetsp:Transcript_54141/g.144202  ORF Transcript_54141/g.144202 Transcript_54141/m.144202 type:complete len:243 (+) Transcript_54141:152-880(+)